MRLLLSMQVKVSVVMFHVSSACSITHIAAGCLFGTVAMIEIEQIILKGNTCR